MAGGAASVDGVAAEEARRPPWPTAGRRSWQRRGHHGRCRGGGVGSDATSVAGITSTAMEEAASRDGVGVAAEEEEDEAASVPGIGATAAEEEVPSVAGVGVAEEEVEEEAASMPGIGATSAEEEEVASVAGIGAAAA